MHSHPVASIPKSNMKAPPLDPSNPTPAHQWLPVPTTSAKLKSASRTSSVGTPQSPPAQSMMASSAAHTIPGPQVYGRFPPTSQNLSEQDLDPYFNSFETATRDLELLLEGNIEKVNRRTLTHLSALSKDMAELGARYNAFSLSEHSPSVAAAIEKQDRHLTHRILPRRSYRRHLAPILQSQCVRAHSSLASSGAF